MLAKIGIDFHGVITDAPEIFEAFCREIRQRGIQVYIISGGPKEDVKRYLDLRKIEYDEIWAILDHYSNVGQAEIFDDGSFKVDTELWNKAKAQYCHEEKIDFHIDDSNIYGDYFVTPYCKYENGKEFCACGAVKIDFKDAHKAAEDVAKYICKNINK